MAWISWIMPLFNLLGLLLAVYKKKEAFAIFMIPNIYWIGYTIVHKTYPMTAVQIIYIIFNIWGYLNHKARKIKDVVARCRRQGILPKNRDC